MGRGATALISHFSNIIVTITIARHWLVENHSGDRFFFYPFALLLYYAS
jgi:hypothetical protein